MNLQWKIKGIALYIQDNEERKKQGGTLTNTVPVISMDERGYIRKIKTYLNYAKPPSLIISINGRIIFRTGNKEYKP